MATTTSNYPSKVSTRPRVLDVKEGYASYPEGFVHIKPPGKTDPSWPTPAVSSRLSGKPQIWGKNLYEDSEGFHLVQFAQVNPGDHKYLHRHKQAETVWVIVEGEGEFYPDPDTAIPIKAGMIAHCYPMEWHGVGNTGSGPLRYISVEGPMMSRPGATEFAEDFPG